MRSVATYPAGNQWIETEVIRPFWSLYKKSHYIDEVKLAFKILGEGSTSEKIKKYINDDYRAPRAPENDEQWRVLCALAKIGEKQEEVAEAIAEGLKILMGQIEQSRHRLSL